MRAAERSRAERRRDVGERGAGSGILLGVAALLLLGLLCAGPWLGTVPVLAAGALTVAMVAGGWLLDRRGR